MKTKDILSSHVKTFVRRKMQYSSLSSTEQKSSFKDDLAFFGHIYDVYLKLKFSFTLINIITLTP